MSQESEIRVKEATSASEGKEEYGSGTEGDVVNDLGNREKSDRKGRGSGHRSVMNMAEIRRKEEKS